MSLSFRTASKEEKESLMALVMIIMNNDTSEMTQDRARTLLAYMADMERDRKKFAESEKALSDAYVRLRTILPGALDTPTAPTQEQIFKITEAAAREMVALAHS